MRRRWELLCGTVAALVVLTLCTGVGPAGAVGTPQDRVVSETSPELTPHILDGTVLDMAQVGNRIIVAGTFTQVEDSPANGGAVLAQDYVFAFDRRTGRIDRTFDPLLNNEVRAIEPGPNGTVYLGGLFNSVNGEAIYRLVQLTLTTGDRVTGFNAPRPSAGVNDLHLVGSRLMVAGVFTTVGGVYHGGLVALNSTTGARSMVNGLPYMGVDVAVNHNWPDRGTSRAPVGVDNIDVSPDGTRMVAIGNFRTADGLDRRQIAMIRLGASGATVDPDWRTNRYEPACLTSYFDSYMRDVQFAPDGSYFAVVTSGSGYPGTLCDTVTRWETTATGQELDPTWASYTGGDTIFAVEVTGTAIYAGGHQRWSNNPLGGNYAAPGAVPRPGMSAHDPRTGVPLAWNPGRHPRGIGVEAMLATADGLYIGMDTQWLGNRETFRPGLAFFPLAGAPAQPSETTPDLPGNVYLGGPVAVSGDDESGTVLHRVNAGGPEVTATDGGPAWSADQGDENPLRTPGGTVADVGPVPTIEGSVPVGTPAAVFETQRAAAAGVPFTPVMSWMFPVPAGTTVDVRLYLSDRDPATTAGGQRLFNLAVEGTTRLGFYDLVGDIGNDIGAMKSLRTTVGDDGVVNVDFVQLAGAPAVNAIEVVQPGDSAPESDGVVARWFDGTNAVGDREVGPGGLRWSEVRGAFMVEDTLYYGYPGTGGDYFLWKRTFDGTAFGEPTVLDPYNDPEWSDLATGTWWGTMPNFYRGMVPNFHAQLQGVTSMVFDDGVLYYTRAGFPGLYSRGFSVDSDVIGADATTEVPSGFSDVVGAFLAGDRLYWATRSTGELRSTAWNGGAPDPAASRLEDDTRSWANRAMFVGPGDPPELPNVAPTAVIGTPACTGLTCTFSSAGSTDPDGTIASRSWAFSDGTTSTQANPSKTFAAAGTYTATLTVTDDRGGTGTATRDVTVTAPAAIAMRGTAATSARGVTSVQVAVPAAVQAGDGMLLVLSTNSSTATGTPPAGWAPVGRRTSGTAVNTQVWRRVATAGDAGGAVPVSLSASSRVTLQLLAYSGTNTTNPVVRSASAATGAVTRHAAPAITAPAGSWVVHVWTARSTGARTWTPPSGVRTRSNLAAAASGDVATLVAEVGPVTVTTQPARTATLSAVSTRGATWSIVLGRAP